MAKNFKDLLDTLTPERQKRIYERTVELMTDIHSKTLDAITGFSKKLEGLTEEERKQKARDYLVESGIHNPDGTLTKEYGGEYTTIPKQYEVWSEGVCLRKYKTYRGAINYINRNSGKFILYYPNRMFEKREN